MAIPATIRQLSDTLWEIPTSHKPGMRVPARIYATPALLASMDDGVFDQITNVATLPGIVPYASCMPDGHWEYGFPIGGVAAMDAATGVISPGGIGFDINCGMRLVVTQLTYSEVKPRLHELVDALFKRIPAGVGSHQGELEGSGARRGSDRHPGLRQPLPGNPGGASGTGVRCRTGPSRPFLARRTGVAAP
jgi:tRNA-splicing ligase RtcB